MRWCERSSFKDTRAANWVHPAGRFKPEAQAKDRASNDFFPSFPSSVFPLVPKLCLGTHSSPGSAWQRADRSTTITLQSATERRHSTRPGRVFLTHVTKQRFAVVRSQAELGNEDENSCTQLAMRVNSPTCAVRSPGPWGTSSSDRPVPALVAIPLRAFAASL